MAALAPKSWRWRLCLKIPNGSQLGSQWSLHNMTPNGLWTKPAIWEPVSSLKIRSCSCPRTAVHGCPGHDPDVWSGCTTSEVSMVMGKPHNERFTMQTSLKKWMRWFGGTPNVRKPPSLNSQNEIRMRLSCTGICSFFWMSLLRSATVCNVVASGTVQLDCGGF